MFQEHTEIDLLASEFFSVVVFRESQFKVETVTDFVANDTVLKTRDELTGAKFEIEIFGAAAYGKEGAAILCTYFDNDLEQGEKEITLDLQGNLSGKTAHLFLLSEKQDLASIGTFPADQPISFKLGLYQTCLIQIQ